MKLISKSVPDADGFWINIGHFQIGWCRSGKNIFAQSHGGEVELMHIGRYPQPPNWQIGGFHVAFFGKTLFHR